eukprot:CAMPEP_0195040148 /NCGR_PEP_ID=MMETSP0326_2-20130528/80178_1 /TAXON_ID=2866 ORGANISM="Crypthecodinium cohnii, Strain Seligo" /NCGR_SAMPLE_ID=MMETSP0326_2 /ASSEMBLY_ACC=CAM_ASM_000348 /LENGTH=225 /DNA_ID=CAMNT_0040067045 /DNA_START=470 /DNA_END=1146 /DNA_ORIENTATION=+
MTPVGKPWITTRQQRRDLGLETRSSRLDLADLLLLCLHLNNALAEVLVDDSYDRQVSVPPAVEAAAPDETYLIVNRTSNVQGHEMMARPQSESRELGDLQMWPSPLLIRLPWGKDCKAQAAKGAGIELQVCNTTPPSVKKKPSSEGRPRRLEWNSLRPHTHTQKLALENIGRLEAWTRGSRLDLADLLLLCLHLNNALAEVLVDDSYDRQVSQDVDHGAGAVADE